MLDGRPFYIDAKKFVPVPWRHHVYPLLNEVWLPDRTIIQGEFLPNRKQREDCGAWLHKNYPGKKWVRSACLGCPFRTNEEWKWMRDNDPEEFDDACRFDDAQRIADANNASERKMLVGVPYVHRQLVPLRMVNLDGDGETQGGGCGSLHDGMDGLCGL